MHGRSILALTMADHRKLSDEAVTILETVLRDRSKPPTLDEIDRLRAHGRRPLRQAIVDRARRNER